MELVMCAAVAAIAITIHPVLARYRARLATGYVVARVIEATMYMIGAAGLLTVLTLALPGAKDLSDLMLSARNVISAIMGAAAFAVSALILYSVLFRTRLVPRWLSVWGLVAAISYLVGVVLAVYGTDPVSSTETVLDLPMAVQEMVLAVWLLIRGFRPISASQSR